MSDAALPRPNAAELLRSVAPDGLCKACIGVALQLRPAALVQEMAALHSDPSYNYDKGRCHRCRATAKRVVRLVTAGVDL